MGNSIGDISAKMSYPAGYIPAQRAAGLTKHSTREDIALLDEESPEDTINKPSTGVACTGDSWQQYLYGTLDLSAH